MSNRKISKLTAFAVKKAAEFAAKSNSNAACVSMFYQPKAPANLSQRLKKA